MGVFAFFVQLGNRVGLIGKRGVERISGIRPGLAELAIEFFDHETGTTAGNIHHFTHQVGIDALGEVFQTQVNVVDSAVQFGGEVVTQVFRVQMLQVGVGHNEGAAGFGHFLSVHGQESVRINGIRRPETGTGQHRRPEKGMEVNDVFTDEVVQLGVGVGLPESVEINAFGIAQGLEAGHVAQRSTCQL